jgi:hypothetical protein
MENDVKTTSTSAVQILVNMVESAKMSSMNTSASACLDTLAKTVRPTLMTVQTIHAKMVAHASIKSTPTSAFAEFPSQEETATQN